MCINARQFRHLTNVAKLWILNYKKVIPARVKYQYIKDLRLFDLCAGSIQDNYLTGLQSELLSLHKQII